MRNARSVLRGNAVLSASFCRVDTGDPLFGLPAETLAEMTGASLVTARRWKRTRKVPAPARRLLSILTTGGLGEIDSAWRHWHVRGGLLCGPDGMTVTPADVLSVPFVRAQVSAYQARARFAVQADWIDRRYVEPGDSECPALAVGED